MTPPNEPLTASAEYQLTQQDLVRALRYPTWGDPVARAQLMRRWGLSLVAGVVVAGALWVGLGASMFPFVVVPVVLALEWPLLLWIQPKGLAKIYAKQPGALEPARMTVGPEALLVTSARSEIRIEWHAIRDLATTDDYTLFILGRYQVVAVPWRCFDSPSAAQRLTVLAREYWLASASTPRSPRQVRADVEALLGPDRMVVDYELTMTDVRILITGQLLRKRRFTVGLGISGLLFGLFAGLLGGPLTGVASGLLLIAFVIALVVGGSLFNARRTKGILGQHTLIAAPSGYWSESPGVLSSVQRWSVFTDVAASGRHLLLFRGPDMVVGIPRHAFASVEESNRFLALITGWRLAQLAEANASSLA